MSTLAQQEQRDALFALAGQSGQPQSSLIENFTFHAPWAARVFGVTLASSERGIFSMQEFQKSLIKQIEMHEKNTGWIDSEDAYYSAWVSALSDLLQEKRLISAGSLAAGEEKICEALVQLQHNHDHHHGHDEGDDNHHHHHHKAKPAPIFVKESK
jgi:nitrile hydratase accessory protein